MSWCPFGTAERRKFSSNVRSVAAQSGAGCRLAMPGSLHPPTSGVDDAADEIATEQRGRLPDRVSSKRNDAIFNPLDLGQELAPQGLCGLGGDGLERDLGPDRHPTERGQIGRDD